MSTGSRDVKRVTTHTLQEMKAKGVPIAMLTAYDFSLARLVDLSGIDVILVGELRGAETMKLALQLANAI